MAYDIICSGKTKQFVLRATNETPTRIRLVGVSIPFVRGGLSLRPVADYFFPSSHLLMKLAVTPATTERKNETIISIEQPSLPCRYGSGNVKIISH